MMITKSITVWGIMIYFVSYVIPMSNERKQVFKFTKIFTIQTVTNIDQIARPPISTESRGAISCAALLMQYGPFTSMEFYKLESTCRSFHEEETVLSLNNKTNNGWSLYNAEVSGKSYEECRLSELGREYRGIKNTTETGIQCMVWSATYPHMPYPPFVSDVTLEEGSEIADTNYCRNPDFSVGGPWCYTMDPLIAWEFCGVPYCHCYTY